MSDSVRQDVITLLAPAKLNLYLHVTGRRKDGYHELESLVAFADIADRIMIEPAAEFSFRIQGPFAAAFSASERDISQHSQNLVVKAVWACAGLARKKPDFRITLIKNLPLASGVGGGSSDAAAVLWGLASYWGLPVQTELFHNMALSLGADVPVCLGCRPVCMKGVGDVLETAPFIGEAFIVLVNPGVFCETKQVFSLFKQDFRATQSMPEELAAFDDLVSFLTGCHNDLTPYAQALCPEIVPVLDSLQAISACALARMSGSGATCFGLFEDEFEALEAARIIAQDHPHWWVQTGALNRVERY